MINKLSDGPGNDNLFQKLLWTISKVSLQAGMMGTVAIPAPRFKGGVSWYSVDLDLPPGKRWAAVIGDKKAEVSVLSVRGNVLKMNLNPELSVFLPPPPEAGQHGPGHQEPGERFCAQREAGGSGGRFPGMLPFSSQPLVWPLPAGVSTLCSPLSPAADGGDAPAPFW